MKDKIIQAWTELEERMKDPEKSWNLDEFIISVNEQEFTKECILKRDELGLSPKQVINLLSHISDKEFSKKIYTADEVKDIRRNRSIDQVENVYDNLDFYLEMEGRTEDKDTILRMYQKNARILLCDFKILDYIKYFGEDKINLIACYEEVQYKIFSLSEPKVSILASCIDYYEKQYNTEEWMPLAQALLDNIDKPYNEDLLDQILQKLKKNEVNMENLIDFIINSKDIDYRRIDTIEAINNYEPIREMRIKYSSVRYGEERLKNIIIEKIFNHDLDRAKYLVEKYGEDIDEIEDQELKSYIRALKEIIDLNDRETLIEINKSIEPSQINIGNTFVIEKLLKAEYAKLYNRELFKIEDAVKNKELGENVYEAGTDFSMIVTSIKAFTESDSSPKNYYEDWNRADLSTQHFCCSYIRNDLISTASNHHVCYGFSSMKEDSFVDSANGDGLSNKNEFVSGMYPVLKEKCYAPNRMIDNTKDLNEIDYYRIQNGEKKQPDYIVVFKANGEITPELWENAKQAQRDFGGKLPIVIVDVDKCLESEKNKVNKMISNYKESPTQELFDQIKQKIRNNNVTCSKKFGYENGFCEDIDLKALEEMLMQNDKNNVTEDRLVTPRDLQECYKDTTPEERESKAMEINQLIMKLKNLNLDISNR